MKIAYVTDNFLGFKGNGITSQARTWANLLRERGVQIDMLTGWGDISLTDYDAYHLFGSGGVWFYGIARRLAKLGIPSVWSPICDDIEHPCLQRLKTFVAVPPLQLFSFPYIRAKAYGVFDRIMVRSQYEADYLHKAYGADKGKMDIVPLSISYESGCDETPREDFCFHFIAVR